MPTLPQPLGERRFFTELPTQAISDIQLPGWQQAIGDLCWLMAFFRCWPPTGQSVYPGKRTVSRPYIAQPHRVPGES